MSNPLGWGILGTGNIARKFAAQLPESSQAKLVAAGSRSADSAGRFVEEFAGKACAGYDRLLADPDVEAVYVSLPNALHREWTIRALEAGKHVLCEKPLAVTAAEAEEMFAAAERCERVLVEAFMYRCHPAVVRLIETVRSGGIGQLKLIRTHFTFNRPEPADDVRYQPQLAGGSLMDVGCYCINLARALAGGEPTAVHAACHLHPSGVDDYAAGTLDFDGRLLAAFTCGMTVEADRTTYACGSEGYIAIDTPWFSDGTFTLVRNDERETIRAEAAIAPYALEAEAFARAVRDGAAPWITKTDTLGNLRVLDALRRQIGLPF
ncbi:MAG: Gfo/Idh/MocA family oxidoreductase [Planctomycetes bacterium]|nr:Gfo/Idh/MocA family oxidoreductase [Planctomycetota bacterium]